jgi:hypothetical protein
MRSAHRFFAAAAVAALTITGASTSSAGVVFGLETTYHDGAKARVEDGELYVLKPNLRMAIADGEAVSRGGAGDEVIFRGDLRQMIVVDHGKKVYTVMDPEVMEKIKSQMPEVSEEMKKARAELDKQMASMSPKQREMMEKMLKDKMPPGMAMGADRPHPEYRKTGERETINGYPCVRYDVYVGDEKTQELWVTDYKNVKGAGELTSVSKDMAAFYAEVMQPLSDMAGGMFDLERNPIGELAAVEGFPVVTRVFSDGKLQSETVLKSVDERDIDPSTFEPPKGYKLHSMGE